jgi:hypothetical protein
VGGVIDVEDACGAGGVVGALWGAAEGVGTTQGTAEVNEVRDEEATKDRVVRPLGLAVGPPATGPRAV